MIANNHFAADHIRKYPFAFYVIILIGFINSCISFLLPVLIGEFFILNYHTGSTKGKLLNWLGLHVSTIYEFFILFFILIIAKGILGYVEQLGTYRLGELFVKDIREKIFSAQIHWDVNTQLHKSYEKYLLRYSNDMKTIQSYFTKGIMNGIKNSLFLLTGLFLLSRIHFQLTLVLAGLLISIAVIIYIIAARQRPFIRSSRNKRSSLLAYVSSSFRKFNSLKQNKTEENTISKFKDRSHELYHSNMQLNAFESLMQSANPLLIFVMIGLLLYQISIPSMQVTSGDGLLIILMILMMQGSFRNLLRVPGYINKGNISLVKINKILQTENLRAEEPAEDIHQSLQG